MVKTASKFVWQPDKEVLARANVVRLMRRHGIDDYWDLVRRSQDDPEWFWPAAIEDMGLEFFQPWDQVVDLSRGPEWATWFVGGRVNIAWNCVHRWAERRPDAVASVGLGEDGTRREQTFGELSREVTKLAEALLELGVRAGDRVAIFLPMSPEVPIASHACAHIGAIQVPDLLGLRCAGRRPAAPGLRGQGRDHSAHHEPARPRGADARDPRRSPTRGAVASSTSSSRPGTSSSPTHRASCRRPSSTPRRRTCSTYTSGTTGTPKGVVHVQGGFLVSIAREVCYQADAGPDDRIHFVTDMGWIMGPWTVVGGHAMGSTLVFAEGAPDWPTDRLWKLIESERVSVLGISPTLDPRADPARRARRPISRRCARSSRPASRGTPSRTAGSSKRSAARGARSSTARAAPRSAPASSRRPSAIPIKACSLGGPALGMAMDVVDAEGNSVRGRGRRARLPQAVPGHDARVLARPRALPRHLLATLSGDLDAR